MQVLRNLLKSEETRDDPESTAAIISLAVSEKVRNNPFCQQKENEKYRMTVVQKLFSSIPQILLMRHNARPGRMISELRKDGQF